LQDDSNLYSFQCDRTRFGFVETIPKCDSTSSESRRTRETDAGRTRIFGRLDLAISCRPPASNGFPGGGGGGRGISISNLFFGFGNVIIKTKIK
jgi:hypothetical protein